MLKLIWKERLGLPECVYLTRWVLQFKRFSIRLHYWTGSDDQEYYHDHAWWFRTFVLWGGYLDISPGPDGQPVTDTLTFGSTRYREAEYKHKVKIIKPTVTLMITGPDERKFGFWINEKFVVARRYFFQYGHHPCEDGQPRVKTKPGKKQ